MYFLSNKLFSSSSFEFRVYAINMMIRLKVNSSICIINHRSILPSILRPVEFKHMPNGIA